MSLQETYQTEVVPKLKESLKIPNDFAVPRITKVSLNVGVGKSMKDAKDIELVENTLTRITGQKPVQTKAKKSIAGFKVREGAIVGVQVTLRGKRMYDFLEKLIHFTLPRVRDFRGLDRKNVGPNGNCSIGFKEHIAFPEISPDEVERIHGLAVTISTTATTHDEGIALLLELGFPFKKE